VTGLLKASAAIDAINTRIGIWVSWLILIAVLISTGNAIIRKVFDASSNAWLELQWQLFGAVFMLAAAWTLIRNEHIRIDIVNSRFPKAVRNWIELIGHVLFLIPLCLIMLYDGIPFFIRSVEINEQSANAGGLAQWPAKLLIPLGFALLLVQAFSEIIKRVAVMRGLIPDPHEHHDEPTPVVEHAA
jgi:TRAP-type mannitol/chloroaromatic compound transport system permease small subunit